MSVMPVGHPCKRSITSTDTGTGTVERGGNEQGGLCVSAIVTTHGMIGLTG